MVLNIDWVKDNFINPISHQLYRIQNAKHRKSAYRPQSQPRIQYQSSSNDDCCCLIM